MILTSNTKLCYVGPEDNQDTPLVIHRSHDSFIQKEQESVIRTLILLSRDVSDRHNTQVTTTKDNILCERMDNSVSYSTTNNALGLPKVLQDALGLPLHRLHQRPTLRYHGERS